MGWHRDDDYAHGGQPAVASRSLGAPRTFRMRPVAGGPSVGIRLAHGSLLVIDGEGRTAWSHALPRTAAPVGVRVNLTFRHMVALVAASPR
jgi:alkylated DNA repair dioxygenase AlkB